MPLSFVTSNEHKFREALGVFPELVRCDASLLETQEINPEQLIKEKLREAEKYCQRPYIVEDQWLELDSLGGMPGPFIKWFRERMGDEGIYDLADKYHNYKALNRVLVGYKDSNAQEHYFSAVVEGTIVAPRGSMDFGWGVIFQPAGSEKTYAEMLPEEKFPYNPRVCALESLRDFLGSSAARLEN